MALYVNIAILNSIMSISAELYTMPNSLTTKKNLKLCIKWLLAAVCGLLCQQQVPRWCAYSLTPYSKPGHLEWDLWWAMWNFDRFLSQYCGFPPSVSLHQGPISSRLLPTLCFIISATDSVVKWHTSVCLSHWLDIQLSLILLVKPTSLTENENLLHFVFPRFLAFVICLDKQRLVEWWMRFFCPVAGWESTYRHGMIQTAVFKHYTSGKCHCRMEFISTNKNCATTLRTKRRLLYLKTQFVPRSKHFSSRL